MNDDGSEQGGQRHGPPDQCGDVVAAVAALRRAQQETDAIARESAGLLSELAPNVLDLETQLGNLTSDPTRPPRQEDPAVTAVKAELGMLPTPSGPWCWPLFDAEQAAAAWDALARWVDQVLVPGYAVTRGDLVDCWPLHPPMVNELSWLRASHLEAHTADAAAVLAQDWHLRALPGALAGLRAAVPVEAGGGRQRPLCGPGHHQTHAGVHDDEIEERRQMPASREHWEIAGRDLGGWLRGAVELGTR